MGFSIEKWVFCSKNGLFVRQMVNSLEFMFLLGLSEVKYLNKKTKFMNKKHILSNGFFLQTNENFLSNENPSNLELFTHWG